MSALVLCVPAGLLLAVMHAVYVRVDQGNGFYARGFFEREARSTRLIFGPQVTDISYPNVFVDAEGRLQLPPGTTVGIRLSPGSRFTIRQPEMAYAPYIVVGTTTHSPGTFVSRFYHGGHAPAGVALERPTSVVARDGHMALAKWDIDAPWSVDSKRLEAQQRLCKPDSANTLTCSLEAGAIEIHYGKCTYRGPAADGRNQQYVLGVLGAVGWVSIESHAGSFAPKRFDASAFLMVSAAIAIFAALAVASWGLVGAVIQIASLAIVLLVWPRGGVPLAVLLVCATTIGILLRAIRRSIHDLKRGRRWMAATTALVLFIGVTVTGLVVASFVTGSDRDDSAPVNASCVLVGYSSARGVGLRAPGQRVGAVLQRECDLCGHGTTTVSRSGATLRWAAHTMCRRRGGARREATVFWGGVNDDYLFWKSPGRSFLNIFAFFSMLGQMVFDPPHGVREGRRVRQAAAAASERHVASERQSAEQLFACLRSSSKRTLYAEHFMIQDLAFPIGQARAKMRAARRDAARHQRVEVLRLLDVLGGQAGVSWFADEVHPSQIGHAHIAALICQRLGCCASSGENAKTKRERGATKPSPPAHPADAPVESR